jgi:hypothetical protein
VALPGLAVGAITVPISGLVHPPSGLSKATWTDADFSVMGWHDCRIHAISIGESEDDTLPPTRLLLDLDYVVRWVESVRPHATSPSGSHPRHSCSTVHGTSSASSVHSTNSSR